MNSPSILWVVCGSPVDRLGNVCKVSARCVLRKAAFVLVMGDLLIQTQIILKLIFGHVREHVVLESECPLVAGKRLGILRVDLIVGHVVSHLLQSKRFGLGDILVILSSESLEVFIVH